METGIHGGDNAKSQNLSLDLPSVWFWGGFGKICGRFWGSLGVCWGYCFGGFGDICGRFGGDVDRLLARFRESFQRLTNV